MSFRGGGVFGAAGFLLVVIFTPWITTDKTTKVASAAFLIGLGFLVAYMWWLNGVK